MVQASSATEVTYPDSDGQPMADNTQQFRWITRLVANLKILLKDQPAFVAGDLLWYPVRVQSANEPPPSQAPDVMVVLGRPDGDRGSYKQWQEDNVAPQVVFEIISPGNSDSEMGKKQNFYAQYGVLEMYFYDPESFEFWGLVREQATELPQLITPLNLPWQSPLLGVEFKLFDDGLSVFHPNGRVFKDPEVLGAERDRLLELIDQAPDIEQLKRSLRDAGIDLGDDGA
ncbi:MAG: Uma2 family endonuclease [Cyanobacteria bacterium P01_H01_bin.162]